MSLSEIDIEQLIDAVKDKEEVWNPSNPSYNNKINRRNAWLEISQEVYPNFDSYDSARQMHISSVVMSKWKHVRDAYSRSIKYQKILKEQGSKKKPRKYLYKNKLTFLEQLMLSTNNTPMEDDSESKSSDAPILKEEFSPPNSVEMIIEPQPETFLLSPTETVKTEKNVEVQMRSENTHLYVQQSTETKDEDMEFFSSLLSSIRKFNEDEKLQFRLEVIGAIQKLRRKFGISYATKTCKEEKL